MNDFINKFEDSLLSNLLLKIYYIDKKYLNKNIIIENLNNYCKRNKIKKEDIDNELEWASFLSKTREPFDEIILPLYTSESIIKLFSLKNEKEEIIDGMFSLNLLNENKPEFNKQIYKLLFEEKYTQTLTLTLQTIFEISMITIYNDKKNIKNVDDIQNIFKTKFKDKINNKEEVDVIEVLKEITENINADRDHKRLLEFISDLFKYLLQLEDKDLSIKHYDEPAINDETKDIIDIIPEKKDEEGFSEEFSKSLIVPDINISISKKIASRKSLEAI